jgi:uncharacterized protein (DUF1501 family)
MTRINASRRLFLSQAGALSTLGAAAPLALNLAALGNAAAQSATDYKALVCIFLRGGNDSLNMVLRTDGASWTNYRTLRNQAPDSIALMAPGTAANLSAALGSPARLGGVLPITPANAQGTTLALHPLMTELQALFNASTNKRLAIVANLGTLILPTNKLQYDAFAHPKPVNLFSHNDQSNIWQSGAGEGASLGWGGRLADLMAGGTPSVFTAMSTSGNAVWLSGQNVNQYQVSTNGAVRMGTSGANNAVYGSAAVGNAMRNIVRATRGTHPFERDIAAVNARSIPAEEFLRGALLPASDVRFGTTASPYVAADDPKLRYLDPLSATPGTTKFSDLAQQLQTVARMIQVGRDTLGLRRQVFFVGMDDFDNHDDQNRRHAANMARLSHAMNYFNNTLDAIGAQDQAVTFTASDFGRTFTSNGDGTDHGWGAHHLVMGGPVKGGDVYGTVPFLGAKNAGNNKFDSSPDQIGNGALIPTTSVDQLGATLAHWFGVSSDASLVSNGVFANLANFSTKDLGFIR